MKKTCYYILFLLGVTLLGACNSKNKPDESTAISAKDSLMQEATALAHRYIILDGHIDLPYRLKAEATPYDVSTRTEKGDFDYVKAKEGGLDAPFMSIFVPYEREENGGAKALADSLIDMVEEIIDTHPEKFATAASPEQIKKNFKEKKISLPMGMENGAPIEGNLENISYFHQRGIRYITLTHSKDNHICDSSYDTTRTWNGLSPFGEEVVREMNKVGIIIDVSHISDSTFYQVMALTKAPVIASHSSCRHFIPGFERNMSDDMIRLLADNGGVIQINFGSTFVDEESKKKGDANRKHIAEWAEERNLTWGDPELMTYADKYFQEHPVFSDVSVVANHIDHVIKLVGVDHVGFGSDFDGVGNTLPENLKDVSHYPNLIYHLMKKGYTEKDIEKICYKNVFRVWKEVEKTAQKIQAETNI